MVHPSGSGQPVSQKCSRREWGEHMSYRSCGARPGTRHADSEYGIGSQLGLVGCAIERSHEAVDVLQLRLEVELLLDERGTDDFHDVANCSLDALSAVDPLDSISQFGGFGRPGRGARWHDGPKGAFITHGVSKIFDDSVERTDLEPRLRPLVPSGYPASQVSAQRGRM